MPKITMEEFEEFPVLAPESIIGVKVEDLETRDVPGKNGKPGWTKLEFTFKITQVPTTPDNQYDSLVGSKIWGSVPFRFNDSPDNKLKQWTEALLGMELSQGFELDTDLLIGREARAIISNYDKKNINPRTGQAYKAHQVDALLVKGGSGVTLPQTAPAPAPALASSGASPQATLGGWSDEPPF